MGSVLLTAVIGGLVAIIITFLILLLIRRRRRQHGLTVLLSTPVIKPVSVRPEWYVDITAQFVNNGPTPVSIVGIRSIVSAPVAMAAMP